MLELLFILIFFSFYLFYFIWFFSWTMKRHMITVCHMQVYSSGNYIPAVKIPPKHISLSFMAAIFPTTHFMAVLQPFRYPIFHGRDTPIQLGLSWQSHSYQCLNTETSAQGNRALLLKPQASSIMSICI